MRIISGFHDFYDSLMDGSDSNIWSRNQESVFIDQSDLLFKRTRLPFGLFNTNVGDYIKPEKIIPVETMILIFCERLIPLWRCSNKIGYTFEGLKNLLASQRVDLEKTIRWGWFSLQMTADLFGGKISPDLATLNMKYKCPIILLRQYDGKNHNIRYVLELNPCLKDLEFQRIGNIVDTFQALERFIFNELLEVNHLTSTGNDKVIAACKGFGDKYAFRKEPQKNR